MATWRLFRPLKTLFLTEFGSGNVPSVFKVTTTFQRHFKTLVRPSWSMMTCSMLIMNRVKFLKVANGTRIEKFYDLEPNYSDIEDKIRRQNWTRFSFWKTPQSKVSLILAWISMTRVWPGYLWLESCVMTHDKHHSNESKQINIDAKPAGLLKWKIRESIRILR